MRVQNRFKNVHWMLLAVVALAPAALAQQAPDQPKAAPANSEAPQVKTDAAPAKSETAPKQTEEAQAQQQTGEEGKLISVPGGKSLGISILGNQEAPKALVIVPWKSSELGNARGISTMLDDSRLPIDKEVFMRMLSYYEIREEAAPPGGAPAEKNATQPDTAAPLRRKQ
jgi:hypothetical protein